MPVKKKQSSEAAVREIRRRSRRRFSAEEKIRVVLEGLRGEMSVAELCRREGIASNLYYRWSKDFLEAGKKRLNGDTVREATSGEVKFLRSENRELKEVLPRALNHEFGSHEQSSSPVGRACLRLMSTGSEHGHAPVEVAKLPLHGAQQARRIH